MMRAGFLDNREAYAMSGAAQGKGMQSRIRAREYQR